MYRYHCVQEGMKHALNTRLDYHRNSLDYKSYLIKHESFNCAPNRNIAMHMSITLLRFAKVKMKNSIE